MAVPTEIEFALIKMGDGATPTEGFAVLCGLQDATVNTTANTSDRFVRDCAKPALPPFRAVKTNGRQQDITGSGLTNIDLIGDFQAAIGRSKNYKIECYRDDGSDTGELVGTFAGAYVMTASNLNMSLENAASSEITLASDGAWTWTEA